MAAAIKAMTTRSTATVFWVGIVVFVVMLAILVEEVEADRPELCTSCGLISRGGFTSPECSSIIRSKNGNDDDENYEINSKHYINNNNVKRGHRLREQANPYI
ncbi:hypothetical protein M0R45_032804 [Rubus argutus]|uniref:Uncharacterized protein n=1 Tax=Rubus argutus TaxID=59490 RepID=A0AAW1WM80_RUBAR